MYVWVNCFTTYTMASAEWFHAFFFWCTFCACVWKYVCQKHEETSLIISKHPLVSPNFSPPPHKNATRPRNMLLSTSSLYEKWEYKKTTTTTTTAMMKRKKMNLYSYMHVCLHANQPFRRHPCTPAKAGAQLTGTHHYYFLVRPLWKWRMYASYLVEWKIMLLIFSSRFSLSDEEPARKETHTHRYKQHPNTKNTDTRAPLFMSRYPLTYRWVNQHCGLLPNIIIEIIILYLHE